jgi:hypothetical protein
VFRESPAARIGALATTDGVVVVGNSPRYCRFSASPPGPAPCRAAAWITAPSRRRRASRHLHQDPRNIPAAAEPPLLRIATPAIYA